MLRWLMILAGIILVGVAVTAWVMEDGRLPPENGTEGASNQEGARTERPKDAGRSRDTTQRQTPPSKPLVPVATVTSNDRQKPLVINEMRATLRETQEVPSQRSGKVMVVGTEVAMGEPLPPPDRLVRLRVGIPLIRMQPGEQYTGKTWRFADGNSLWREWKENDPVDPSNLRLHKEERLYRTLEVGDSVQKGQVLAVLDQELPLAEIDIKLANYNAAVAKRGATEKTREEYAKRLESLEATARRVPGSISREDIRAAQLAVDRYAAETVSDTESMKKAEAEMLQSRVLLSMHTIRAEINGKVKMIYAHRGEAVKEQERVVQLQNQDLLRVEGLVDVQDAQLLQLNQPVFVETAVPRAPQLALRGPLQEVTAVAVSKGGQPWVIAASTDRTIWFWRVTQDTLAQSPEGAKVPAYKIDDKEKRYRVDHPAVVRAVACSPKGSSTNLCLVGAADGSARLWNLDNLTQPARELKERHNGAIQAVAFSPNGTLCATAGEDRTARIWNSANGELVARIPEAHQGAVTQVAFATDKLLVTAGRDAALRSWNLEGKDPTAVQEMDRRSSTVDRLGVSPDGKYVLFDQGKELQVLSLADRSIAGVLKNTSGAVNFTTMALFSPGAGNMILTAGAADNRLQLWRSPLASKYGRAAEVRQFVWSSTTTSAAFAPEAPFVVTGTADKQVLLWSLPPTEVLEEATTPNAKISLVDRSLDAGSRQVRVWADLIRPTEGLIPGATATLVAYPAKN